MVFYFSGTGNSKYIGKRLADGTESKLYSVNNAIKNNESFNNTDIDLLIFSLPTYAWRIPRIVEKWIRKSTFKENAKAYFVMNCGGEIGNAEKYLRRLCKDCNLEFMGCGEVVMPENYLAMFSTPTSEQGKKIIARAEPVINSIIDAIKSCERLPSRKPNLIEKVLSSIINLAFYPLCVKATKFSANNTKCVGCSKCVSVCPLNNVILQDKKPVWGDNCTHCMACISICPASAIEYGKKSIDKPRYRCPYE